MITKPRTTYHQDIGNWKYLPLHPSKLLLLHDLPTSYRKPIIPTERSLQAGNHAWFTFTKRKHLWGTHHNRTQHTTETEKPAVAHRLQEGKATIDCDKNTGSVQWCHQACHLPHTSHVKYVPGQGACQILSPSSLHRYTSQTRLNYINLPFLSIKLLGWWWFITSDLILGILPHKENTRKNVSRLTSRRSAYRTPGSLTGRSSTHTDTGHIDPITPCSTDFHHLQSYHTYSLSANISWFSGNPLNPGTVR